MLLLPDYQTKPENWDTKSNHTWLTKATSQKPTLLLPNKHEEHKKKLQHNIILALQPHTPLRHNLHKKP